MNTQVSTDKANTARKLQLLMDEGSADRCNKFWLLKSNDKKHVDWVSEFHVLC